VTGLRQLVALSVTLSPGRAEALLGRLAGGAPELRQEARALATRPRRERLAALSAALAALPANFAARAAPAPARPTSALPRGAHPLLERARLEAAWRAGVRRGVPVEVPAPASSIPRPPSVARTLVRPAPRGRTTLGPACATATLARGVE